MIARRSGGHMAEPENNASQHFEDLRTDGRDEIKRRIQQRDQYSIQLTVTLAAIIAGSTSGSGSPKLLLLAPLAAIYFTKLILTSYRMHDVLAEWLRDVIEPHCSEAFGTPLEIEWETWQRFRETPGIRRKLFVVVQWAVTLISVLLLTYLYWSSNFFKVIEVVTILYLGIGLWVDWSELTWHISSQNHRDWPEDVTPVFPRAVFLDRDGTINEDTHYPSDATSLRFVPGALEGLKVLARLPVQVIVISNQGGIALGYLTRKKMRIFNTILRLEVEKAGARIDGFYYCPHLEKKNLPPSVSPCSYSKPAPGMLKQAAKDFRLTLPVSFMIGDKTSDVAAGQAAGCKSVLLLTGKAGKEDGALATSPDHISQDLIAAAEWVSAEIFSHSPDHPGVLARTTSH
jgi:D-glycero-D-manno-heptose 1,7-bisphosphate phosphatase